jgi:hypothetical protein
MRFACVLAGVLLGSTASAEDLLIKPNGEYLGKTLTDGKTFEICGGGTTSVSPGRVQKEVNEKCPKRFLLGGVELAALQSGRSLTINDKGTEIRFDLQKAGSVRIDESLRVGAKVIIEITDGFDQQLGRDTRTITVTRF